MSDDGVETYAQGLLSHAREELLRAENKAVVLLATSGVAVAATMAGLIAGDWGPFNLDNRIEWVWWGGALSTGYAILRLGSAIYPRTRRKSPPPSVVAYFADVDCYRERPLKDLKSALAYSASRGMDGVADQLRQVSHIAVAKYTQVRHALLALGAAAVLCLLAVLVDATLM